jgi:hypothetical protein
MPHSLSEHFTDHCARLTEFREQFKELPEKMEAFGVANRAWRKTQEGARPVDPEVEFACSITGRSVTGTENSEYIKQVQDLWEKTGLLRGLDSEKQTAMALMLQTLAVGVFLAHDAKDDAAFEQLLQIIFPPLRNALNVIEKNS